MLPLIILGFFKRVFAATHRWTEDGASLMAAAVSYYLAVSLFPLLLILVAGSGMFFRYAEWGEDAKGRIVEMMAEKFSPGMGEQVGKLLGNVQDQATTAGPLGIATLFLAAIATFIALDHAFNRILKIPEEMQKRGIWAAIKRVLVTRLKAFLMLGGVGLMLLASMLAGVTLEGIQQYTGALAGERWIWRGLSLAVGFALNMILFTVLYHEVPNIKIRWSDSLRGALLAAVTWELGRQLLAAFVVSERFSAYGLVGSFIAVLVWVYYGVCVILLGAEYVQVLVEERNKKQRGKGRK